MSEDPVFNRGELGPYLIERKLGQGAMGGVYLGKHKVLEVHHAIKMIHSRLLGDKTLVERFLREARNTAKMKHMNIVQVVGADLVDGIYYLAMEYVQGKTLEQLMRSPGLSLHDAVRYIHMIANALQYAHSRGIIHRDIKPANIMINDEDIAKLMDFGLVRDIEQPDTGEGSEQLTMAGFIMGTPQYMPVEQWNGEGVDHRSDIYALGATLYAAISGRLPFPGKTPRDIFRRILTSEAIDVRTHNEEIDDELAGIVHTAIAPEKDDRYQTTEEFALALERWWDNHPYQGTSLFMAPVMDETRRVMPGSSTQGGTVTTRSALTHHSSMSDSSPSSLNATGQGKSKAPIIAASAIVLILLLAVGGWLAFGGKDSSDNTPNVPPPVFEIGLKADEATEALPLAVTSPSFSIPGKGDARVNGDAYTFGSALKLKPGLNKLVVAPGAGGQERVLYVLVDEAMPEVKIDGLESRADNIIPTDGSSFTLRGNVSDKGCGLKGLKLELRIDGQQRELVFDDKGNFTRDLPVADKDVTLELQAIDRAGNRSKTLTFWVVPDRVKLAFLDKWSPSEEWVTSKRFTLKGQLSKARGVTLKADGTQLPLSEQGNFMVVLTREPGEHEIKFEATDWLGASRTVTRTVFVDLEAPKLELEAPTDGRIRVAVIPGLIEVKGRVDDPNGARLKVNEKDVALSSDGSFETTATYKEFGEFKVVVEVTDPAGRSDRREVSIQVQRLMYEELEKNTQGYREFKRLSDGMTMVLIPAGEYTRGAGDEIADAPKQQIKMTEFLIAKYEVTNDQYAKFLSSTQSTVDNVILKGWLTKNAEGRFEGLVPDGKAWSASPGVERRPVVNVTWAGAFAYCQWADDETGNLPSEAQWEYAARGTDQRAYPWGDGNPNQAQANYGNNRESTTEVTKQETGESFFGVRNMAGNVEEWCIDWYTEGSYSRPDQQGTDPCLKTKPNGFDRRVVRGGGFLSPLNKSPKALLEDEMGILQSFSRARRLPDTGAIDRGFRPVAKLPTD
ncbi:MAG: SUMF1/EgtB/PvdO family nonheme iron enzyme [Planctomycetota bacterium]